MLTLMLLRHGKAVATGKGDDFDRDLTDVGRADATRLGGYLARIGYVPAFALVSPAKRTVQTYQKVATGVGRKIPVTYQDELYNGTSTQLLTSLRSVQPQVESLLVVGHNPGIMEAAATMAGDGDRVEIDRMRNRFPPCALAIMTFSGDDWHDVRASGGRLEAFVEPEDPLRVR